MHNASFEAFRSLNGGSFGALTLDRNVMVIHRGMLRKWEIVLAESDLKSEIASKITTNTEALTEVAKKWLGGIPISEIKALVAKL
jgi:hypothetical protein